MAVDESFGLRPSAVEIGLGLDIPKSGVVPSDICFEVNDVVVSDYTIKVNRPERGIANKGADLAYAESNPQHRSYCTAWLFGTERITKASLAVRVTDFRPWLRLVLPAEATEKDARKMVHDVKFALKHHRDIKDVQHKIMQKPKLYGFRLKRDETTDTPEWRSFWVVELSFRSCKEANSAKNLLKGKDKTGVLWSAKLGFELTDLATSNEIKFLCSNGVNPAGFAVIKRGAERIADDDQGQRLTTCQLEFESKNSRIAPASEEMSKGLPSKVVCALDGEMYSNTGLFPNQFHGDTTFCLSSVLWRTDQRHEDKSPILVRCMYYLGTADVKASFLGPQTRVFCFESVRELFEAFRDDTVVRADVDIFTGWNIFGFDIPFLIEEYQNQFRNEDARLMVGDVRAVFEALAKFQASPSLVEDLPASFRDDVWRPFKASLRRVDAAIRLSPSLVSRAWDTFKRNFKERFAMDVSKGRDIPLAYARHACDLLKQVVQVKEGKVHVFGHQAQKGGRWIEGATVPQEHLDRVRQLPEYRGIAEVRRNLGDVVWSKFLTWLTDHRKETSVSKGVLSVLQHCLQTAAGDDDRMEEEDGSRKPNRFNFGIQDKLAKVNGRGLHLSRFWHDKCHIKEKMMDTAAKGMQIYCLLGCESDGRHLSGRVVLDLMQLIKDDKKPPLESLSYAAETWLGDGMTKLSMDFHEMFEAFASGDPRKQWLIIEYCARDAEACIWLIDRMTYVPILVE